MPRRSAVSALHVLRRIETLTARRSLAEAQERARNARATIVEQLETLNAEARGAQAADFSAWLPLARALLEVASANRDAADTKVQEALAFVISTLRAERGVAAEVARQVLASRAERLVEEQKFIEEAARAGMQIGQDVLRKVCFSRDRP